MLTPPEFEMTTFPNDEGYDELVLVEDIPVQSLCEHHMLPFVGVAHVGYLPGERILGLSKLARTVEYHCRYAQTQERLTQRVADHLRHSLAAKGVGVVIEAEHTCMTLRGARVPGSRTVTSALFGRLRDDPATRGRVPGVDPDRKVIHMSIGDRRRRTGRGQGRRGAARAGVRRRRSRCSAPSRTCRTNARRCPRACCWGRRSPTARSVHDAAWYADHDVDLRTVGHGHRRSTSRGRSSPRATARWATTSCCSRPARSHVGFAAADDSGARVAYLRTLDDCAALRAALQEQPRVVIVGAGWIGLEVAAAARTIGCEVTVVEPQSQPLLGVMGERIGATFADLHRAHGVDLRLGTSVEAVEQDRVVVSGGEAVPAGLVVVAVGAAPRLSLAEGAGLATGSGVLVDARLRTADPHVYAAGDIADHDHPVLGHRVRVEHWDNAIEQGKVAARNMLGEDVAYERAPYFFTDQYDLGMEYVGHAPKEHTDSVVVRGDLAEVKGIVAWHDRGTVLAAMHVNEWDATDDLRSLLGRSVDLARFEDPSVPLSDLVG